MKTHELMDDWKVSGTDLAEFKDRIEDISNSTYVTNISTDKLTMLHYLNTQGTKLLFSVLMKHQIEANKQIGTRLDIQMLYDNGISQDFIDELEDTKLMLRLDGEGAQREDIYFTSSHLSRDLAARAQLAGDAVYDPTIERDTYIMSRYSKQCNKAMAVVRRNSSDNNAVHKVFALPTATYRQIDQRILIDIIDQLEADLGKCECRNWSIDHFMTRIFLSFPEKAEDISAVYGLPDVLVPGFLLETSDTGDCSVRVISCWERKRGCFARFGAVEREHRGRVCENDILATMKEKLMKKYTQLPQRLCELMTIDLHDPVAAVEHVFNDVAMAHALGKKRSDNLKDIMTGLVSSATSMTAYEIAMMFLDFPSRFEIDSIVREAAEEVAGKVPFLNFEKIAKTATTSTKML